MSAEIRRRSKPNEVGYSDPPLPYSGNGTSKFSNPSLNLLLLEMKSIVASALIYALAVNRSVGVGCTVRISTNPLLSP